MKTFLKSFATWVCLGAALTFLGSCENDLDLEPLAEVTPETFFQKASDLELYTNSFYLTFPAEGIYNGDADSDNIIQNSPSERVRGARVVPTDASGAGWTWNDLREINYFLINYQRCPDEAAKKHYGGVARFFRAYFYYNKVRQFGDVPWYSEPVDPTDEAALLKPRDARQLVMDSVMADLDFAIANMNSGAEVYRVTKWTALALKSRAALYEGTFRKYHGLDGAEKFLEAAWQSADELMNSGTYQLYMGDPATVYREFFASHDAIGAEMILAREFNTEQAIDHNVNYYTITSSYGMPGMPKDLVNSYLMADGSRFTDQPNYNQMPFVEEVANRDPRLSQTIRTPGYRRIGTSEVVPPNLGATVTGYQLTKYVTEPRYDSNDESITDLPLFRYAEVLLNFAEAKAELGILTQGDLDRSINLLRDRVAMPHLDMAAANADPDPFLAAQYVHVAQGGNQGVILEIRRERRIELFMENLRWDDLMRWKEGQKLLQPFRGMYFPGPGEYDLEGDGDVDVVLYTEEPASKPNGIQFLKLGENVVLDANGLIDPQPGISRAFDESKDYLYPLPITELLLNPNLEQNPGW
ncbi:Starch-binding associating with outer membrane [Catalinimonas alkaloidigena]|uniref:Starch-binding associating with outer membrane n=1 Tax=Catalinimonas alkaloidigena TaxID=1075417 RepID=A0A1G9SEL9_9BACT|nr:RagB/SusD family nutrient uptake outer membrane protein [Catalinimonas alkaloidigena]SDM33832.1 Starch-binding associating with outer membrane [Catalinimonas alkaloidigena]